MKRLAVFLIVGPIVGVWAIMLTSAMLGNKPDFTDPSEWTMGLFACLILSGPSGLCDWLLAYVVRPILRVPLTAACGSAAVAALLVFSVGAPFARLWIAMVIVAICMGFCSWLSSARAA